VPPETFFRRRSGGHRRRASLGENLLRHGGVALRARVLCSEEKLGRRGERNSRPSTWKGSRNHRRGWEKSGRGETAGRTGGNRPGGKKREPASDGESEGHLPKQSSPAGPRQLFRGGPRKEGAIAKEGHAASWRYRAPSGKNSHRGECNERGGGNQNGVSATRSRSIGITRTRVSP